MLVMRLKALPSGAIGMMNHRMFGLSLIGAAVALFLLVAFAGSHASAESPQRLTAQLESFGYVTEQIGRVSYPGLQIDGDLIKVQNAEGASVQAQLFEYDSPEQARFDWLLAPGSQALPLTASMNLNGRSAFWNGTSVLIVDFREPNDTELALAVGTIFLAQSTEAQPVTIATGLANASPPATVQPPSTGDAALLGRDRPSLPLWASVLWAGLSIAAVVGAGVGGLALFKNARH
jgi:hypothetical protein